LRLLALNPEPCATLHRELDHLLERLMRDSLPVSQALRSVLREWFHVPSRGRLRRISADLDDVLLELIADAKHARHCSSCLPSRSGLALR
jgi:hypothetical protein